MKKVTLLEWAKLHGIPWYRAITWARRGKLRTAIKKEIRIKRWEISSDEQPPVLR